MHTPRHTIDRLASSSAQPGVMAARDLGDEMARIEAAGLAADREAAQCVSWLLATIISNAAKLGTR